MYTCQKVKNFLAQHYPAKRNCVPLSGKWNYSITQIPKHVLEPGYSQHYHDGDCFPWTTMENYFSLARNHPRTPLRIPRAVAILATARSHQRSYLLYSDRIHSEIPRNSQLRARRPLSECINFSSFVLDAPRDTAAAAANAITRCVSLCFTTRRLGVYRKWANKQIRV